MLNSLLLDYGINYKRCYMIFGALLAGGIGQRLGCGKPKQFLEICGKPILVHSIEKFLEVDDVDKLIISSPPDYIDKTEELITEYFDNDSKLVVIAGGKERSDTILNSIRWALNNGANEDSIMVTHDAARIFVTPKLIKDSIKYAKEYGAASAVIPATDVIFKSTMPNKLESIPLRKFLYHSQTPQSFNINKYLTIYEDLSYEEKKILDEAMILFNLRDEPVYLFDGDSNNFKITRPFDIILAETILG